MKKQGTPIWRRHLTFWRTNIDSDLDDEIRFHLEMRTRELIDKGWQPKAADAEARRASKR